MIAHPTPASLRSRTGGDLDSPPLVHPLPSKLSLAIARGGSRAKLGRLTEVAGPSFFSCACRLVGEACVGSGDAARL
jgi:hypothetical protein